MSNFKVVGNYIKQTILLKIVVKIVTWDKHSKFKSR